MDESPIRRLLDKQDWADIYARLRDFAEARSRSPADAKDLAQTAITRVFAYDSKWDPEKDPDLVRYLMSVVNSLLANERTSAAARRSVTLTNKHARAAAERVKDERAHSEEKVAETDLFARRVALLKERLVDDAQALRLLDLMTEGVDSPTELRQVTGWSADAVMAVRRRMLRAAAIVARDLAGARDDDDSSITATDEEEEVG